MTHTTPPSQMTSLSAGPPPGSLASPEFASLFQGQRREPSRQSRPCWRRWGRWQTLSPLWASVGGRGDPPTPSPSKNYTGWAQAQKPQTSSTNNEIASVFDYYFIIRIQIRIYILLLIVHVIKMVAVVVLVSMFWFSADGVMLLQKLLLRDEEEKQVLVWLFNVSYSINSPGNWDITLQHICVMEGLLPPGEGWLQLYLHLHNRWLL